MKRVLPRGPYAPRLETLVAAVLRAVPADRAGNLSYEDEGLVFDAHVWATLLLARARMVEAGRGAETANRHGKLRGLTLRQELKQAVEALRAALVDKEDQRFSDDQAAIVVVGELTRYFARAKALRGRWRRAAGAGWARVSSVAEKRITQVCAADIAALARWAWIDPDRFDPLDAVEAATDVLAGKWTPADAARGVTVALLASAGRPIAPDTLREGARKRLAANGVDVDVLRDGDYSHPLLRLPEFALDNLQPPTESTGKGRTKPGRS